MGCVRVCGVCEGVQRCVGEGGRGGSGIVCVHIEREV